MIPPFVPPPPPFIPPPIMPVLPVVPTVGPSAWGTNVRFVTCQPCGHSFAYRLARAASGGTQARARERVRRALQAECDPVPCPACGAYQPDVVRRLRGEHLGWMRAAGLAVSAVGAFACALGFVLGWTAWPAILSVVGAGLGLVLLRVVLARRFDPNDPAGAEARKAAGKRAEVAAPARTGQ